MKKIVLLALASVTLIGCGRSSTSDDQAYAEGVSDRQEVADFDEDAARETAMSDLDSETYESIGEPYGCTEDCGGHSAGFEWAKQHEIDDGSCSGNSESFIEGCRAYGEAIDERIEELRDEAE